MNFPADMLPMYTASMSSDRSFASWIALRPASIPRSRKERSQSSPNSVSPTPMTATSRNSGLPHEDLAPILRIPRVVDEFVVLDLLFDRRSGIPANLCDLVRHGEVKSVRSGAASVSDREDPIAGFRLVEDRAQADHDRAAIRVPDIADAKARV